jgi:hypothetical protein
MTEPSEIEERALQIMADAEWCGADRLTALKRALEAQRRLAFERAAEIARSRMIENSDNDDDDYYNDAICDVVQHILAEIDQPPTPPR